MTAALVRSARVLFLAVAVTSASSARAGLVIDFQESGTDMVATLSGSFTAFPAPDSTINLLNGNRIVPSLSFFNSTDQPSSALNMNSYNFSSSLPAYGALASVSTATSTSGLNTSVYLQASRIFLPQAFSASTPFTGSLTWANESYATFSMTRGSYVGSLSNGETVTINVVPEPSNYAMALAGLACGGYSIWRRRTRS